MRVDGKDLGRRVSQGWKWSNVYRNIHWDDFLAGFSVAVLLLVVVFVVAHFVEIFGRM